MIIDDHTNLTVSRARVGQFLARIPRDVISILVIVLLVVVLFIAARRVLLHYTSGLSIPGSIQLANDPPPVFSATVPKISNSAFSPLPRDFSINQPPWCPACRRQAARQRQVTIDRPRSNCPPQLLAKHERPKMPTSCGE